MMKIEGDHDVFGDGTAVIIATANYSHLGFRASPFQISCWI